MAGCGVTVDVEAPGAGQVTTDVRLAWLGAVSARLVDLAAETAGLLELRRELISELHADAFSHARIGVAAGLSRGRIYQILRADRERWRFD
jgi:hypothetical protein